MATGGNAGDAPFMKQAPLPSREGKFYASEGAKILPGGVYPEIHPSKGNVGDAPGMKQSPGEGKLHTVQIWASPASYTGGDPKTLPGGDRLRTLSGDHPEAISGGGHPDTLSGRGRPDTLAGIDHPTTLAGVGPTIKSGGLMLAGGDPMVAAGYFSKIYTMAVKPPVLSHVPRTEPIVLQSPRDNVGINQLRNFIKRTILRRLVERERLVNKRETLVEKREDRAERHELRVEKREIRADEKETANHATALGLEQERKKIQEDKEQHSIALQQDRKKFDEDQKAAIVALEEERRKLEEHKVKVSQRAAEQGPGEEPKGQAAKGQDKGQDAKGQSALIVSKVETADSRLGLVEKLIDIPKRKQAIMKSIRENVDIVKNAPIVKKYVTPHTKGIQKTITATTTTGVLGYLRVEIRDFLGFPAGVSNGGPKNGTGHEAASMGAGTGHEAASMGAGTGHEAASTSTGAGTGHEAASASTGAGTGHEAASASTGAGAGNEAASASTGAGAGNEAASASTGAGSGVKAV